MTFFNKNIMRGLDLQELLNSYSISNFRLQNWSTIGTFNILFIYFAVAVIWIRLESRVLVGEVGRKLSICKHLCIYAVLGVLRK